VGDWSLYYALEEAVKKVTAADVQRVAKKYFSEDQRTTGWYIPRNEAPAEETAARSGEAEEENAQLGDKSDDAKKAKADEATRAQAKMKQPVAVERSSPTVPTAKIAPRIVRAKTSGIDLLVCPTGVKDVVQLEGVMPAYSPTTPILGELTAAMLERGGTG